eukprot:TRINITY_DN9764_c0_g1_i1.p1 TRINITY_DN9764_c0_g1~~TRINITY_DN9764_c0_g1_i1.p1  ORF type:complete len:75 (+),score=12.97 TRINITY_DN9764_c0_g1_i1:187-411(+)
MKMRNAFHDAYPQAPVHILIIPRKPISQLRKAESGDAELLGHLLIVAKDIAKELNLDEGFRIVINDGDNAGQSV